MNKEKENTIKKRKSPTRSRSRSSSPKKRNTSSAGRTSSKRQMKEMYIPKEIISVYENKNIKLLKLPKCINRILSDQFYRMDTVGNGDCFYHAVLGTLNTDDAYNEYIVQPTDKKIAMVRKFRQCISNDIINSLDGSVSSGNKFKNCMASEYCRPMFDLNDLNLDNSKYEKEIRDSKAHGQNLVERIQKMGVWAGEYEVQATAKYLGINIVVFQAYVDNNDNTISADKCFIYCLSKTNKPMDKTKKSIFIFNIDNKHYESIVRRNNLSRNRVTLKGCFEPTEKCWKNVDAEYYNTCYLHRPSLVP